MARVLKKKRSFVRRRCNRGNCKRVTRIHKTPNINPKMEGKKRAGGEIISAWTWFTVSVLNHLLYV